MTISNKMAVLITSNAFEGATMVDVAWGLGIGLVIAIGAVLLINHFMN